MPDDGSPLVMSVNVRMPLSHTLDVESLFSGNLSMKSTAVTSARASGRLYFRIQNSTV
ncbi:MAG: hypothetical protein Ct9H300mP15_05510 [Gemmatimonadota bacterium]|nr:MAG: hypothetical protein Ct9H300mP15_05510 [Gemmatimonadota bacterium]